MNAFAQMQKMRTKDLCRTFDVAPKHEQLHIEKSGFSSQKMMYLA